MVRAATWLHFGSGGAARPRVSIMQTSIPRYARSIASVSPTGPAPTISTSGSVISGIDRAWCGRLEDRVLASTAPRVNDIDPPNPTLISQPTGAPTNHISRRGDISKATKIQYGTCGNAIAAIPT